MDQNVVEPINEADLLRAHVAKIRDLEIDGIRANVALTNTLVTRELAIIQLLLTGKEILVAGLAWLKNRTEVTKENL